MSRYHKDYDMTPRELAKITGASIRTCQNWVHGQPIHQAYKRLLDLHIAMRVLPDNWHLLVDLQSEVIWTSGIGGEKMSFAEIAQYWLTRQKLNSLEHQVKYLKRQLENFQNHAQREASEDRQLPSHSVAKTTRKKRA